MEDISRVAASGGVSSLMIASLYMLYKCCYRKKIRSRCCGGEMSVSDEPSPNGENKSNIFIDAIPAKPESAREPKT